jgi:hypothetical protein
MRWCGSTSGHVVTFNRHRSVEVRDVDTITSCLMFPKAMVGYCATRDARAESIMAAVPEMTRCCAQPWRDARDATPPQAFLVAHPVVIVFTTVALWEVLAVDTGNGYHLLQDVDGGPLGGVDGGFDSNHH